MRWGNPYPFYLPVSPWRGIIIRGCTGMIMDSGMVVMRIMMEECTSYNGSAYTYGYPF
jgi:hypothetical protein